MTPIEVVLSKKPRTKEESAPSFLRLGGFLWVDFQNQITVERDEEDEIIERLKSEKSLLLIGDQASGKSVILRSVGYKLATCGSIVFFVNADSLNTELAMKDIRNWDLANVVVLVDDVHRNPVAVADFLDKIQFSNVRIILSSRPTNFDVFREGQGYRLIDLYSKALEVHVSEKTILDMIRKHCRSFDIRFKPGVADTSEIIQKCGTDLWLITYLLAAWNP
ncbi:MAG: hypothetical protein MUO85_05785, partial [candidate division Zixibacteria bacterium]|nr:hypothetical protein [candidate division Zixibacteria bacterium]